jgi:hypothetical protein
LRYKTFKDWLILISVGVLGELSYTFYKLVAQLNGFVNVIMKKSEWKKFERKGIQS